MYLFQLVIAMPPVQAICNVLIPLVSVLAMQVIKGPSVTPLVVAIPLAPVALYVTNQQANVLAIQDSQEPPVIPVIPTTIEPAMVLHVYVSIRLKKLFLKSMII